MKAAAQKYLSRILTTISAVALSFKMRADGSIIPISDNGILIIQISLVMVAIGLVFGIAVLSYRLVKNKGLTNPGSYLPIVVVAFLLYWTLAFLSEVSR